ncbi:helix-turn-helix domain-containing protein [Candidatus Pelagisphaera phototrophica]|uniref:helix-turn-helix domain-containing protein n=1 Tax=Candidatus Pelagisphaera phototrophica TaxID=2684113 RepID=UPI0019EA124B|nr:helix-turn-helix domain-containing protein [Candidatus Pelagisphaera phototrophica]
MDKHPDNHRPDKQTTFADIAKRAGVCKATVSLALHNNSRISKETRKRIKEIAHEMGYHLIPSGCRQYGPDSTIEGLVRILSHHRVPKHLLRREAER